MEQLVFYFLIFDCRCRSCCAAVKTTGVQCNSAAETQSRWRAKENIWAGKLPEPEEQALYRGTTVLDGAAVCVWLCSEQRSCRLHTVTADDSLPLTGQISVMLNGFTGSSENLFSLSDGFILILHLQELLVWFSIAGTVCADDDAQRGSILQLRNCGFPVGINTKLWSCFHKSSNDSVFSPNTNMKHVLKRSFWHWTCCWCFLCLILNWDHDLCVEWMFFIKQ